MPQSSCREVTTVNIFICRPVDLEWTFNNKQHVARIIKTSHLLTMIFICLFSNSGVSAAISLCSLTLLYVTVSLCVMLSSSLFNSCFAFFLHVTVLLFVLINLSLSDYCVFTISLAWLNSLHQTYVHLRYGRNILFSFPLFELASPLLFKKNWTMYTIFRRPLSVARQRWWLLISD